MTPKPAKRGVGNGGSRVFDAGLSAAPGIPRPAVDVAHLAVRAVADRVRARLNLPGAAFVVFSASAVTSRPWLPGSSL
jgi:hypothetical protein